MFFLEFLGYLKDFSVIENIGFDDTIDRLNYQGSVIVLFLCTSLVTVRQYFLNPISCYVSTNMGGNGADGYLQNLCWTEGLYPVNISIAWSKRDQNWENLDNQHMQYYQWVPLFFALEAIMFMVPWILWQFVNVYVAGFSYSELLRMGRNAHLVSGEEREVHVDKIAESLLKIFHLKKKNRRNNLFYYYIGIKLIYAALNVSQVFMIFYFLSLHHKEGYFHFGYRILNNIMHGEMWTETSVFPRNGMCRHAYENLGAKNYILAQCSLPINMINEKLFVFLYFYFTGCFIITAWNAASQLYSYKSNSNFISSIDKKIVSNPKHQVDVGYLKDFVLDFVGSDGCFMLRMLRNNVGSLMADEIIISLYKQYVSARYAGLCEYKLD